MQKKLFPLRITLPALCALLFLCAAKADKKKGFDLKTLEKSLCCIPAGKFRFTDSAEISNYKIKSREVKVDSFYMFNHEVSNREYMIFLEDLKSADSLLYNKMYPDTTVWCFGKNYKVEYLNQYYFTKFYDDFPVVGVSHVQAEYYCKWLTQRYMKEEKRKFKNAVFRLPGIYQWEYAAFGGKDGSPFPWGTPYMRNSKGQSLANYTFVPDQNIKRVEDNNNMSKLTVTYKPEFGIRLVNNFVYN
jgi:formylglycine-generating enzyme required for sulfatase activity